MAINKLVTLLLLYFVQGLPFGFQATALPLMLRARGVSLQALGFVGLLAAPWLVKALWAPWVDRWGSRSFGRRKSWIVPMQAALCLSACAAAQVERPSLLFGLVFLMNLCAATQDIAVDGLAVSWLTPRELGIGNAVQVVGYKLGMLTGGGILIWASDKLGFSGVFYTMAILMLLVMLVALRLHEPPDERATVAQTFRVREVFLQLSAAVRERTALPLLAVIVSYKMGETLADAMWKPMLFDRGYSVGQIGLWTGTYGMLASLAGSFGAGLWIKARPLPAALLSIALLRAAGVAAEWWISLQAGPTPEQIIAVTCIEHVLGGAITTVMFTLMMRHTRPEIGGTHYTLLASIEVWGKLPFGALSGVLAQRAGYPVVFGVGTALCVGFAVLVMGVRDRLLRI